MVEQPDELYRHHVTPLRRRVGHTVRRLVDDGRTADELVRMLIGLARMRLGPLRPIPEWQRVAAAALDAAAMPHGATGLRLSAEIEGHHHLFLLDDLVQLHALTMEMGMPCLPLRALVTGAPEPSARAHARIRQRALCSAGVASLAVELELAELGLQIGPALLRAWDRHFPTDGPQCLRWVEARATDARRRASERIGQVCDGLERVGEDKMDAVAHDWSRMAADVVDSYLEAIEAGMLATTKVAAGYALERPGAVNWRRELAS